jgi:integrase
MDNIKAAQFEPGSPRWHARNIFLFSFYNRGMNFADIAKLRISDIEQDRIYYKRSKTGKPLSVKLIDATREILSTYTVDKTGDDFVFPILKRDTPELQMKDLYNERKTFNKYLNKIAEDLEIEGNLTSYVARHSWATIAKDLNVPISVISEGLGHEDIKTTQIYLDEFDTSVIDDANKLITG